MRPHPTTPDDSRFHRRALALFGASLVSSVLLGGGQPARAAGSPEFRVIVHAGNVEGVIERGFVADLFLKKITRWPGGEVIRAVDLRPDSLVRRRFTESILKRSVGAVRSYWQQRIFSGRDVPPVELDSEDGVVAFVAKYPGAVGYVSGATKLVGVRELSIK